MTTSFVRFVAASALATAIACAGSPDEVESPYFDRRDADVYLVPVGPFSDRYLVELADYYEEELGVRMGITPMLPFREGIYNADRKQFATERVLAWMMTKLEDYSTNPEAIFIGVTHHDLYMFTAEFSFVFAQRIGAHHAVVSSRRIAPEADEDMGDITEVQPALRKLVTKTIGLLYFKKPVSDDPTSVMFGPVLTVEALDGIDESTARSVLLD